MTEVQSEPIYRVGERVQVVDDPEHRDDPDEPGMYEGAAGVVVSASFVKGGLFNPRSRWVYGVIPDDDVGHIDDDDAPIFDEDCLDAAD